MTREFRGLLAPQLGLSKVDRMTWTSAFGRACGWLLDRIVHGLALTRISPNISLSLGSSSISLPRFSLATPTQPTATACFFSRAW